MLSGMIKLIILPNLWYTFDGRLLCGMEGGSRTLCFQKPEILL